MLRVLAIHPRSVCAAVSRIEVEVDRPGPTRLALTYRVTGAIDDLDLAPAALPERADELWRRTCFEAFIAPPGEAYFEFNFAPSRRWAAYAFAGYREGMRALEGIAAPRIEVETTGGRCELRACLDLEGPLLPRSGAPWRLGLCAVIEEASGRMSYWALAHPTGRPDFHHADAFACEVPPMEGA